LGHGRHGECQNDGQAKLSHVEVSCAGRVRPWVFSGQV
jgi:hypothetical protein